MSDLAPLVACAPLASIAKPGRTGVTSGAAGVHVRVIGHVPMATVIARRGRDGEAIAALSAWLGAAVGHAPLRSADGNRAVIGVSPGQWLALARNPDGDAAMTLLQASLREAATVADQGDGCIVVHVSGPRVRDALCKGIAIDLDPRVFRPGDSAGTVVAHLAVQISCLDAAPTYEIIGAASTAGNLWHWLESSAAEFGLDVVHA